MEMGFECVSSQATSVMLFHIYMLKMYCRARAERREGELKAWWEDGCEQGLRWDSERIKAPRAMSLGFVGFSVFLYFYIS